MVGAAIVILPLMYALWWLDPFRIRRLPAAAGLLACLAALTGQAITVNGATGIPTTSMRQLFATDGDQVMTAWLAPDGHYKALVAHGSLCQPDGRNYFGDCESIRIIDGLESP